jgi:hypothetical protein
MGGVGVRYAVSPKVMRGARNIALKANFSERNNVVSMVTNTLMGHSTLPKTATANHTEIAGFVVGLGCVRVIRNGATASRMMNGLQYSFLRGVAVRDVKLQSPAVMGGILTMTI